MNGKSDDANLADVIAILNWNIMCFLFLFFVKCKPFFFTSSSAFFDQVSDQMCQIFPITYFTVLCINEPALASSFCSVSYAAVESVPGSFKV